MYTCKKCGKSFTKSQSFVAHCRIHTANYKGAFVRSDGTFNSWNKGRTKLDDPRLARLSIINSDRLKRLSVEGKNKLVIWNHKKNPNSYKNQSKTLKFKYANGLLTPAFGVGKGKYSYIIIKNRKWMLRSTYEMIVALYFYFKNYDYKVEAVRVIDSDGRTRISDFSIGKRIFEVKFKKSFINNKAKLAFINSGYQYSVIDYRIIGRIKRILVRKFRINIERLISDLILKHDKRDYLVLNTNDLFNYLLV